MPRKQEAETAAKTRARTHSFNFTNVSALSVPQRFAESASSSVGVYVVIDVVAYVIEHVAVAVASAATRRCVRFFGGIRTAVSRRPRFAQPGTIRRLGTHVTVLQVDAHI